MKHYCKYLNKILIYMNSLLILVSVLIIFFVVLSIIENNKKDKIIPMIEVNRNNMDEKAKMLLKHLETL